MLKVSLRLFWGVLGIVLVNGTANAGEIILSSILESPPSLSTVANEYKVLRSKLQKILGTYTYGDFQTAVPDECQVERLMDVFSSGTRTSERDVLIQSYLRKCQPHYSRYHDPIDSMLLDYLSKYDFLDHPDFKRYMVRISGVTLNLVLGLKRDPKPLPLVIIQCGMLCNSTSQIMGWSLMDLFDASPFHVLLVPSISGLEFQRENKTTPLGGAFEGRILHELAGWLRSNEGLKGVISSVHVFGFSLGGHSALYSSLYESKSRAQGHAATINSVAAVCPVVDLKQSLHNLTGRTRVCKTLKKAVRASLEEIVEAIPLVGDWIRRLRAPFAEEFPVLVGQLGYEAHSAHKISPSIEESLEIPRVENLDQFWEMNNFLKFSDSVDVPTLVVGSKDDPVVSAEKNWEFLQKQTEQNGKSSSYDFVPVDFGGHCSIQRAYGFKPVIALYTEFFRQTGELPLPRKQSLQVLRGYRGITHAAEAVVDYDFAGIQFQLKKDAKEVWVVGQYRLHSTDALKDMRPKVIVKTVGKVPLDQFQQALGIAVPKTDVEAQVSSRFLNYSVDFRFTGAFGNFDLPVNLFIRS